MGSGITDADGHGVRVTVTAGPAAPAPHVALRFTRAPSTAQAVDASRPAVPAEAAPSAGTAGEELLWSCTPEAARELAASLVRAAEEAENAPGERPLTVPAAGLRRGDVRDGDRAMTVESVRTDGGTVQVTWRSGAGRSWTQAYDADTAITLKRRLRESG
ncbi:hypothetical protein [Streptomyces sp. NPDC049916]|uniref:hypothetical protein n=1 Tax=Streptomyces sp. NPDC049916 TaxID=3155156 RepID=UPI003418B939